jgi:hypothetical protein
MIGLRRSLVCMSTSRCDVPVLGVLALHREFPSTEWGIVETFLPCYFLYALKLSRKSVGFLEIHDVTLRFNGKVFLRII